MCDKAALHVILCIYDEDFTLQSICFGLPVMWYTMNVACSMFTVNLHLVGVPACVYVIYFHSDNNINVLFVKYRTRNKDEDFSNITDVLITKMKNKKLDDKDYGKCACFGLIKKSNDVYIDL